MMSALGEIPTTVAEISSSSSSNDDLTAAEIFTFVAGGLFFLLAITSNLAMYSAFRRGKNGDYSALDDGKSA